MAENSVIMRKLAVAQIFIGILLIALGITDRLEGIMWTGDLYFGVWIGEWVCWTGTLGVVTSLREITSSRKVLTGVFLSFSIISALLGLGLIVIYGLLIVLLWDIAAHIPVQIAIASILLTLGISEVVTGIWSAVCCCRSCCAATPSELEQPFVIPADEPEPSYEMPQGSGGVPVLFPVGDSFSTTPAQGTHSPANLVHTSGVVMDHPPPYCILKTDSLQSGSGEFVVQVPAPGTHEERPRMIQQQRGSARQV